MRTLLAGERTTAAAARVNYDLKVEIQDADGTWIDRSSYVVRCEWGEHRDQPVATGVLELRRASGVNSLAPLMADSPLNVDGLGAYAPAIDIGRGIRLSTSTHAPGGALAYREVFQGRIDDVAWEQDPITVPFSSLDAWLMDTQIEETAEYGSADASISLEDVLQAILDATPSILGAISVYVPDDPTWFPAVFTQDRVKVLEALRNRALDIGWDLRFRYDAAHVYRLTLIDPDRDRVDIDTTIPPNEYRDIQRLSLSLADIRNVGSVPYVDGTGTHTRTAEDAGSIALYGRRYFELPGSPSIDSAAEADRLIEAAVSDLSTAPAAQQALCWYLWFVQLYDRYTFAANGHHYDDDQTFAVNGYRHVFEGGDATTELELAGRVVGSYADWLKRIGSVVRGVPTPPPVPRIRLDSTNSFSSGALGIQTMRTLRAVFEGEPGAEDMAPLSWRHRIVGNELAVDWSAWSSAALPYTLNLIRGTFRQATVELEVRQADGQQALASLVIQGSLIGTIGATGGRSDEDGRRGGRGGIPVRGHVIPTDPVYSTDGTTPLIDPVTRRFTTDLSGPTGITATVIETGGNRGFGGFANTTGGLVSTATDSRSALLNNHFRYATDGAAGVVESGIQSFAHPTYLDGSRRPTTLRDPVAAADVAGNDINVGQSRARGGFTNATGALVSTAVDSRAALLNNHFRYATDGAAGVVESGTQSFAHPTYLDGSRRPITLRDSVLATDVGGNDINVGQSRARGGFTNATGALVNTAVDSRAALLNNHFRYGTDSTNGVVDGTGSPLTGGARGFIGLNSSSRLQTGVTTAATGADGYAGIESRRGAARQTGHAAIGITHEGMTRGGLAGVPTLDQLYMRLPIYDRTGTQILIDPDDFGALSPFRTLGTTKDRAKMQQSVVQSIPNNLLTVVDFDTTPFDVGVGLADLVNNRFVVPADNAGLWVIRAQVVFASNATGYRLIQLEIGGSPLSLQTAVAVNGDVTSFSCWAVVNDPTVGDAIQVKVKQNSGGALNTTNNVTLLEIFRIW